MVALAFIATLFAGAAAASTEEEINSNLDRIEELANQNKDLVPDDLEWLVSLDGKANLNLELQDGETLDYRVYLDDGTVAEITPGEYRHPQVVVESDESTVRKIYTAGDREAAIEDAYHSSEIDVKERGLGRITVGAAKAVAGLFR
ncbi:MAG: hypothetical protein ABEK59_06620 [Halobacteria archaeon]